MSLLGFYVLVSLLCATGMYVNAVLIPSGKCDDRKYNTSGINIQKVVSQKRWNIMWITDGPELNSLDHGFVQCFKNVETGNYNVINVAVLSDGTRITNTCVFSDPGREADYFLEECVNDDGSIVRYRNYSLYHILAKGGLYLRCVEGDVPGVTIASDTVIIGATGWPPITTPEMQEMQQINMQTFGVPLRPLPWALP